MSFKTNEEQLALAILDFNTNFTGSMRKCAAKWCVNYSLFYARLKGRVSRHDVRPSNNRLKREEEEAVLEFLEKLHDSMINGNKKTLESYANYLLGRRAKQLGEEPPKPVSHSWAERFLNKHHQRLRQQRESLKELDRAAAEDPEELSRWFQDYQGIVQRCGIQANDVWNYDETGIRIGVGKAQKIIVRATKFRQRVSTAKEGARENVTICETINASGLFIPPLVIFASSGTYMEDWVRDTRVPGNYLLDTSESGYINDEIALDWIKHFDEYSKKSQIGDWRLLVLDGHDSHKTFEFLQYCLDNKIIPYFLLPHTTQICQPLDVGVFQPYKHWHGEAVSHLYRNGVAGITKADFLEQLHGIRCKALKPSTIRHAFEATGLWPYNPEKVLEKIRERTPDENQAPLSSPTFVVTPKSSRQADKLAATVSRGDLPPEDGFYKLLHAYEHRGKLIELQDLKIKQMTAVQQRKREINQSKRQIPKITGQPGAKTVAQCRKAVRSRQILEEAKQKRKEENKRRREAKDTASEIPTIINPHLVAYQSEIFAT